MMSSDEGQIQNIYRYSRKSYKKNRRGDQDNDLRSPRDTTELPESPRSAGKSDEYSTGPGCSCDIDVSADLANILHKKCPVVTLAQHQLHRLLQETDKLLCDNATYCRSMYDFIWYFKELLQKQHKVVLVVLVVFAYMSGLITGAATCGSQPGRFNSPILACIEKFFIFDALTQERISIF